MKIPKAALLTFYGSIITFCLVAMGCKSAVDRLFTLKTYQPGEYSYDYDCFSEEYLKKVRFWWLEDMKPRRKTTYYVEPFIISDTCVGLYVCQFWRTKHGRSISTPFYPILRFEDRFEFYQTRNDSANLRIVEEFIELYHTEFADSSLTFLKALFMAGGYSPHRSRSPRREN